MNRAGAISDEVTRLAFFAAIVFAVSCPGQLDTAPAAGPKDISSHRGIPSPSEDDGMSPSWQTAAGESELCLAVIQPSMIDLC